jgi:hypothetical protein
LSISSLSMVIGSPLAKLPLLACDDHLHKIIYTLKVNENLRQLPPGSGPGLGNDILG